MQKGLSLERVRRARKGLGGGGGIGEGCGGNARGRVSQASEASEEGFGERLWGGGGLGVLGRGGGVNRSWCLSTCFLIRPLLLLYLNHPPPTNSVPILNLDQG